MQTTAAVSNQAGSAFFETPLESRHLIVEFDQTIDGGSGADGQTLTFADATQSRADRARANRAAGSASRGIPGIAVAFDTYKNSGQPLEQLRRHHRRPSAGAGLLHWLATSTAIPALRTATRHVKVETLNGTLNVWVEGTKYLSTAVTLPPKVLVGFTGGTGGSNDIHKVANVTDQRRTAVEKPNEEPPAATLKITNAVSAPCRLPAGRNARSPTAAPARRLHDRRARATAARPHRRSPAPSRARLHRRETGAHRHRLEDHRLGQRRRTRRNRCASGGKLTVPAFALAAGANTVAFTNTYTAPKEATGVPDHPRPERRRLAAQRQRPARKPEPRAHAGRAGKQAGSAFWPTKVDPRNLAYEFTISIGGGTGADGLAFVIADATKAAPTALGERRRRARLRRHLGHRGRLRHLPELRQPLQQLHRHQRRRRHHGGHAALADDLQPAGRPRCGPAPTKSRSTRPKAGSPSGWTGPRSAASRSRCPPRPTSASPAAPAARPTATRSRASPSPAPARKKNRSPPR